VSDVNDVAQDQLRSFVERIERLEEEKKEIADDIKDVYGEAKGNGFNVKVLRRLIALRKLDQNERQEQEAILDLYLNALGMNPDLPFGDEALPIQRKGRKPRPATGTQRTEDGGTTISLSTIGENGERITTPPVDLATAREALDQVKRSKKRIVEDAADERLRNERAKGPVWS
jgi:uncharacterized protein (UPF0335 family)